MNRQQRRAAQRRGVRMEPVTRSATFVDRAARARKLYGEGNLVEAERVARAHLQEAPRDAGLRVVLARCLLDQRRLDEAAMEARRAVSAEDRAPAVHETLGRVLLAQDRVVEAISAFERAVELAPNRAAAQQGLGSAYYTAGMADEAIACFQRVTELEPRDPAGYVSIAAVQLSLSRYDALLETVALAKRRGVVTAELRWNGALGALGAGRFEEAWEAYEYGFEAGVRQPDRRFGVPRWDGRPLAEGRVLLWREQGLGDEVRFASCLPDVAEVVDAIVEVSPRLVPLLARSFPTLTVRGETVVSGPDAAETDPTVVSHCPLGSLPKLFRSDMGSFPAHRGYLVADADQRQQFRERLDRLGAGLKVGITWRSMNLATERLSHYATLEELAPVLRIPGVTFVNLQYGPPQWRDEELDAAERAYGVHVHRWADVDYTDDIDGVAALTAELDLVVGPGSFPTVLAGALGVPTFLFRATSTWTHGADGDPWFPATRSFVRGWREGWSEVMTSIAGALEEVRDSGQA